MPRKLVVLDASGSEMWMWMQMMDEDDRTPKPAWRSSLQGCGDVRSFPERSGLGPSACRNSNMSSSEWASTKHATSLSTTRLVFVFVALVSNT
jgi:hypothetical protein